MRGVAWSVPSALEEVLLLEPEHRVVPAREEQCGIKTEADIFNGFSSTMS